jgi:hypothetical protein
MQSSVPAFRIIGSELGIDHLVSEPRLLCCEGGPLKEGSQWIRPLIQACNLAHEAPDASTPIGIFERVRRRLIHIDLDRDSLVHRNPDACSCRSAET